MNDKKLTRAEIEGSLGQFYGSETFLRYGNSITTEGVKFIADSCEAYWLLDIINSIQHLPKIRQEAFQVFKLIVHPDKSAVLDVTDGNKHIIYRQVIEYTDFPLEEITLWRVNGTVMLVSEY